MKKSVSTLLISSAILGGVYATQANTAHAAETAASIQTTTPASAQTAANADTAATKATTDAAPAGQQVNINGKNDQVDAVALADSGEQQTVGTTGKVAASAVADEDFDGNTTGSTTVYVGSTDEDAENEPLAIDSEHLYQGETSHYAEQQTDGSWAVNSITATTGAKTAGTKAFTVDVKDMSEKTMSTGDAQTQNVDLTDGVTAHIQTTDYDDDIAAMGNHAAGLTFDVNIDGANMQNDNFLQRATADDDYQGMGAVISYAGVPLLFHYYVGNDLYTGTLTLTNGAQAPAETTTPAKDDTTAPAKDDTTAPATTDAGKGGELYDPTQATDNGTSTNDAPKSNANKTNSKAGGELTDPNSAKENTGKPSADGKQVASVKPAAKADPAKKNAKTSVKAIAQKSAALPTTGESRSNLGLFGLLTIATMALFNGVALRKRH